MKQRVLFVGLSGVGKSTVLNELEQLAKADNLKLNILNYGNMMMDLAKSSISDRDDIRKASTELQHELQSKVADKIFSGSSKDNVVVVDTHLFIKTPSGYLPGIPDHVLAKIKPDLIVLMEAPIEDIVHRRVSDQTRKRGDMLTGEVNCELDLSRAMASACAMRTGAPLAVVTNEGEKQAEVAKEFYRMIKS